MSTPTREGQSITIKAGGISDELNLKADWYIIMSLTRQGVEVRVNRGPFVNTFVGDNTPARVDYLQFRNRTANDCTIDFIYGLGATPNLNAYNLPLSAMMEAPTRCKAWNGTEVTAGQTVAFTPLLGGGYIRQKSITVQNVGGGANLEILDRDNNVVIEVQPNEVMALPISEAFSVKNPTGAGIACRVSQIYYINEILTY